MPLYPYQEQGVKHLLSMPFGKPHALLADAPGTGKTIMTIEAAKRAGCTNGIIMCPAIIKEQWRDEMLEWELCGEDEIQVAYGHDWKMNNRPWVVINYDLVRQPNIRQQLASKDWHMLAMDEAHRLKTHRSIQTQAVFHKDSGIAKRCYWKWALSGTIIPNRPVEFFPLLITMAPEVIHPCKDYLSFLDKYCGGRYLAGKGASNVPELTARLQPFMLRRELRDVWKECPPLVENQVLIKVPFEKHPEWLGSDFMQEATERRVVAESKIPYIVAYLKHRLENGSGKLTCFTYHREVIEQVAKALPQYNPVKIYGGISQNVRLANLSRFTQDPHCQLFLGQIGSAGEGLDGLQRVCAEYIYAEPEWSPGREDQAGRRILRLGQTRTVFETTLLAAGSYEEVIYNANKRKRRVINIICKPNGGDFVMPYEDDVKRIANSFERIATCLEVLRPVGEFLAHSILESAQAQGVGSFAPPAVPVAPVAPVAPPSNVVPMVAPQAPTVPATPSLPAPDAPAMPSAVTPAVPSVAPSGTVPTPPPVAPSAADTDKSAFEQSVIQKLTALGQNAPAKLTELNKAFGIERLGLLPAEHRANFTAHVDYAVQTAQAV